MMTNITEQKLSAKLEEFERSTLYLKNNFSIAYLAVYCGVNSKYLSHLIKKHKNKDFNNYINELRINYIIDKLRKCSHHRNYKIATLAEEAGFSSPNKFSSVFKKHTSFSPSFFIKCLEKKIHEYII